MKGKRYAEREPLKRPQKQPEEENLGAQWARDTAHPYDTSHLTPVDRMNEFWYTVFDGRLYLFASGEVSENALLHYYESIREQLPEAVRNQNSFGFSMGLSEPRRYDYAPEQHQLIPETPATEQAAEAGNALPEFGEPEKPAEQVSGVYYDESTGITADFSGDKPSFTKGEKGDEPLSSGEVFELIKRRKEEEDPRFVQAFPLRTTADSKREKVLFHIPNPGGTPHTLFEYVIYTDIGVDFSGDKPVFSAGTHPVSSADAFAQIGKKLREGDPQYVQYFHKVQYKDQESREKITFYIKSPSGGLREIEYVFPDRRPKESPHQKYLRKSAYMEAVVEASEGIRLHSTPSPHDTDYQLQQGIAKTVYANGAKVIIKGFGNEENTGWTLIEVKGSDGTPQTGWIELRYLKQEVPDAQAVFTRRKHEVQKGEKLENLLMQEYGKVYNLEVGDDLRTIAEAFANLNKDNPGVYYTGDGGSWRNFFDPAMADARKVYQTIRIKEGHTIRLPSIRYINDLKKAGKLSQRSDLHDLAIEFSKGAAGFSIGYHVGVFKGAYDTVTGLAKLIYQLFTGELYTMFKKLFSMSWEEVKQLFGALFADFEKKWNHPNPYKRWYFRGEVLGQIAFEIALAVLSAGSGLLKNLSRIEKLAPIIKKFDSLKKIIATATKTKADEVLNKIKQAAAKRGDEIRKMSKADISALRKEASQQLMRVSKKMYSNPFFDPDYLKAFGKLAYYSLLDGVKTFDEFLTKVAVKIKNRLNEEHLKNAAKEAFEEIKKYQKEGLSENKILKKIESFQGFRNKLLTQKMTDIHFDELKDFFLKAIQSNEIKAGMRNDEIIDFLRSKGVRTDKFTPDEMRVLEKAGKKASYARSFDDFLKKGNFNVLKQSKDGIKLLDGNVGFGWKHIKKGHVGDVKPGSKSMFPKEMNDKQIKDLIMEACDNGKIADLGDKLVDPSVIRKKIIYHLKPNKYGIKSMELYYEEPFKIITSAYPLSGSNVW